MDTKTLLMEARALAVKEAGATANTLIGTGVGAGLGGVLALLFSKQNRLRNTLTWAAGGAVAGGLAGNLPAAINKANELRKKKNALKGAEAAKEKAIQDVEAANRQYPVNADITMRNGLTDLELPRNPANHGGAEQHAQGTPVTISERNP